MNHKMINLLLFYQIKLTELGVGVMEMKETHPDPMRRLGHCLWMILKMRSPNWDSNEIKTNRWLGYIQGVLNAERIFTILELRDHTRPLYNDIPEYPEVVKKMVDAKKQRQALIEGLVENSGDTIRAEFDVDKYESFHTNFHRGTVARTQTELVYFFKEAVKLGKLASSKIQVEYKSLMLAALERLQKTKFPKMNIEAVKQEIKGLDSE